MLRRHLRGSPASPASPGLQDKGDLQASRGRRNLVPTFPTRHPVAISAVALVVAGGAITLLPQAHFDQNPLLVRDPTAESVQAFEELLSQGSTSPWSLNAVRPDIASAEALAEKLAKLPAVESAHTVTDFVPRDQGEKLAIDCHAGRDRSWRDD